MGKNAGASGSIVDNRPPPPRNVDAGVHPAVAAMREAGKKKADMPAFNPAMFGLGKLDALNAELANSKRKAAEPAGGEKDSKKKKKDKKKKDKKGKKKKEKKKSSSSGSS